MLCISLHASSQIVPSNTEYNQNIEWENVFTSGPEGKVNRGIVDSDGNILANNVRTFKPEIGKDKRGKTGVEKKDLINIGKKITEVPKNFNIHNYL